MLPSDKYQYQIIRDICYFCANFHVRILFFSGYLWVSFENVARFGKGCVSNEL